MSRRNFAHLRMEEGLGMFLRSLWKDFASFSNLNSVFLIQLKLGMFSGEFSSLTEFN